MTWLWFFGWLFTSGMVETISPSKDKGWWSGLWMEARLFVAWPAAIGAIVAMAWLGDEDEDEDE